MSWNWGKFGLLAGGFLLGTYGVKILGSRDMKNTYTHTTAAVLRMKDEVVKDFTTIGENCSDIAAAGREDLVKEELAQLEYINFFLPKMMSEEETAAVLDKAISDLGATSVKDMGKIMNYMKETYPNQYDAKFVGTYVKSKF